MAFFGGNSSVVAATFVAKDQASASINTLRKNMASLGGPRLGPLGNLVGGFAAMAGPAFLAAGAIGGVTAVLGGAIKGAIEEEQNITKLGRALAANVDNWHGNTQAIEAQIAVNEKLAFSDDEQRDALSQLVTRTHDVNKAMTLMRTAMDLARLKGMSLSESVTIIGKVYSGQVTAAKRAGIAITANATATEALAQIQQAASGQAEAYAQTTAGSIEAAQIKWNDALEDIGKNLLPAVTDVVGGFTTLLGALGEVGTAFDNLHRLIDPNYALMEDTRKAVLDQAEAWGVSGDALNQFIEQQKAAQAASDAAVQQQSIATTQLDQHAAMLGMTTVEYAQYTAGVDTATESTVANAAALKESRSYFERYINDLRETKTLAGREAEAASASATARVQAEQQAQQGISDARSAELSEQRDMIAGSVAAERDRWQGMSTVVARDGGSFVGDAKVKYSTLTSFLISQSKHARDKSVEYVSQIPKFSSDAIKSDLGLVKQAMAAYRLAITEPVSKAKERAAIIARLQSKEVRRGLKSNNPQIRQDTQQLVDWLNAKLGEIRGNVVIRGTITGSVNGITSGRRRAGGGPVWGGESYIVGENGPETLHMGGRGSERGWVSPNGGGGKGVPAHSHPIYLDGQKVAVALADKLDDVQGQQDSYSYSYDSRN
jgi:hypothetical protein